MAVRFDKKRRQWEADVRVEGPDGKARLRRLAPTRKAARELEAQLLRQGSPDKSEGQAPLFERFALDEYLEKYCPANNRPSVIAASEYLLRLHMIPAFSGLRLDQLTAQRIDGYKGQKLAGGLSAQTVYNHLTVLRRILSLAVEWGVLLRVPKIKRPRPLPVRVEYLTGPEAERLLAAALPEGPAVHAAVLLGLRAGLRAGEIRGLQWSAVDLARGLLTVDRSLVLGKLQAPKSGKARTVPMHPELKSALDALSAARPVTPSGKASPWVLAGEAGGPQGRDLLTKALRRAVRRAGVPPVTPHGLRHSFATQLVHAGAPLTVVKELLGHSSITVTVRYAHLAPGQLAAAVALLGRGDEVETDKTGKGGV